MIRGEANEEASLVGLLHRSGDEKMGYMMALLDAG
jgi:hypothetical protein